MVTLLCAAALAAVACRFSISVAFAPARAPKVATRAFEEGKVNLGVTVEMNKETRVPRTVLDCDESCIAAIKECTEEGCSVEAMMSLNSKLEEDEEEVKKLAKKLKEAQKTGYNAENAGTIAWLDNFIARSEGLRKTLMAAKEVDNKSVIQKLIEAASIAFTGTGRGGDYPKSGASPYTN